MLPYDRRSEELVEAFRDKEYRESYAEDFLNTYIATQIRVLREQRGLTQTQLAEAIGTKQTAISRMENVNNAARNIGTLLKIAFQLGCRLKVSIETFGTLIDEIAQFSRESLQRPSFEQDPVFQGNAVLYSDQVSGAMPITALPQNTVIRPWMGHMAATTFYVAPISITAWPAGALCTKSSLNTAPNPANWQQDQPRPASEKADAFALAA
jgi:transcriptional regulator with XRE-family HTH domain